MMHTRKKHAENKCASKRAGVHLSSEYASTRESVHAGARAGMHLRVRVIYECGCESTGMGVHLRAQLSIYWCECLYACVCASSRAGLHFRVRMCNFGCGSATMGAVVHLSCGCLYVKGSAH